MKKYYQRHPPSTEFWNFLFCFCLFAPTIVRQSLEPLTNTFFLLFFSSLLFFFLKSFKMRQRQNKSFEVSLVCLLLGVLLVASEASSEVKEPLEVFLVPHSHCDAGWLVTAEQYYIDYVHNILDSVTTELLADDTLRFVWAETIWFQQWWEQQTDTRKLEFANLVKEGRLEFVGGGWVMNDEAIASYADVIEQVTTGHEYLRSQLGPLVGTDRIVRHGWQIDMFTGYSAVTPSLWALMGYDATVIRYEGNSSLFSAWNETKTFEFIWQGSRNLPFEESSIFTHVIEHTYGEIMEGPGNWAPTFDWEYIGSQPVDSSNIQALSEELASFLITKASYFRGPFLAVWGNDFRFPNASVQFGNMSQLVNYINENPSLGVKIRYSTLAEYFDYLYALNWTWPVINYLDFEIGYPHVVPSFSPNISYQTGALTSRPLFKGLIRESGSILRAAEILFSLVTGAYYDTLSNEDLNYLNDNLIVARRARGLVQHHDSLAGTMSTATSNLEYLIMEPDFIEKFPPPGNHAVLEDYISQLQEGITASTEVITNSLGVLLSNQTNFESIPFLTLDEFFVTSTLIEGQDVAVNLFNSLGWTQDRVVEIQILDSLSAKAIVVTDSNGKLVESQRLYYGEQLATNSSLFFVAQIPPLGYSTYYLSAVNDLVLDWNVYNEKYKTFITKHSHITYSDDEVTAITNGNYTVTFNSTTGLISSITNLVTGKTYEVHQQMMT
eukprot:TRINITY_DN5735_c0_g1_i1.p1 TRINITY_DN5735_c0_g1~~TRINITY_DN5735_c0_g1_i1.p1  ORF type:complete len:722 (-),score=108.19 TRINITY_DN5735_c0_g1_i1:1110-3275(-)